MATPTPRDFGMGSLFNSVSDAVIVGNVAEDRIVLWNRGAERMFGYHREQIIGQPVWTIVSPEQRLIHRAGMQRYRAMHRGAIVGRREPVEVEAIHRDGRVFPVELTLSVVEGLDDHIVAVVRDVERRRQAEHAAARRRGSFEFFREAGDQLRRRLTELNGALRLAELHLERANPDAAKRALAIATATLAQSAEFVQDLLESARLEARELTLQTAPIDLRSVVRETASSDPTDRLVVSVPPRPVIVDVDARRIRQILTELVSNARKFSALDDPVELTLTAGETEATITVRDRGLGVPPADVGQIFEAFRRGSNVGDVPGTGLGLFIARRLADLHGGRIVLEHADPGTTVALYLPLSGRPAIETG